MLQTDRTIAVDRVINVNMSWGEENRIRRDIRNDMGLSNTEITQAIMRIMLGYPIYLYAIGVIFIVLSGLLYKRTLFKKQNAL